MNCNDCPRNCNVFREKEAGFCGETSALKIAWAGLHFGEEPLLTADGGSGTIFLTGCNLKCAFCQNYQISQNGMGKIVSESEFSEICIRLQKMGAENINIVTGSHHARAVSRGLSFAKERGLSIPVCWNSSGYDSLDALKMLDGLVSIFLPDLKTLSDNLSLSLCAAKDYPEIAKIAIKNMIQKNPLKIEKTKSGKEKITSGVIVRHLFLPARFEETAEVLTWLKENANGCAIVSLMSQYTPVPFEEDKKNLEIRKKRLLAIENRTVNAEEDSDLRDLIEAFDFEWLFYQDLCAGTEWLPDFSKTLPFQNSLAKTLWHWKTGFCEDV